MDVLAGLRPDIHNHWYKTRKGGEAFEGKQALLDTPCRWGRFYVFSLDEEH